MDLRPRNDNAAAVQPGAKVVRINHENKQLWVVQQVYESNGHAFISNECGGAINTSILNLEVKESAPPNFKPRGDGLGGGRSDGREGAPAPRRPPATARAAPARPRKTNAEVARVLAAPTPYLVLGVRPYVELDDRRSKAKELKEARNELLLSVHRDKGGTDEATRKVNEAYEDLMKPICEREVSVPYVISHKGRISMSRELADGDVVFWKTRDGEYPKAVVCQGEISNIFDIIIDEGDGAALREKCKVKGGDLTPVQLQPTVSPSPSPSRDDDDDDAFAPPPDTSDDEAAPTSPERRLAKRPAEDSLVTLPKRPKQRRSLRDQWDDNSRQSLLCPDLHNRFEKIVAAASDAARDALKDEQRILSAVHAASPQRWTAERLERIDERLGRIHPDRGIDVLLLCGGMGACVVAIYNVGIRINSVTNWEIDPEARLVLENFCKKHGIAIETGQPISAPPAVERPPSRGLAVTGNVDFAIAEDLAGKKYDVASATCSCVHFSLVNANRGGFNAKGAKQYFSAAAMLSYAEKENEDLNYLVENVIMDEDDTEKYNKLFRVPHVRTTDGTGPNSRPRSIRSTMRPVHEKPRCFATFQDLLDKLYGEGKYFALVSKIDCLKASARPTDAVKRCRATGAEEELAIEEALLLMGFPADWFEGCDLEEDAMWRLLGNSCNVGDLELFYKSLLRVHGARHGRDVAKEREDAIRAFRVAHGF